MVARNELEMGPGGVEPPTSRLSGVRSNHLSYEPLQEIVQSKKLTRRHHSVNRSAWVLPPRVYVTLAQHACPHHKDPDMAFDLREHLQKSLGAEKRVSRELRGGGMARVFVADELMATAASSSKSSPPISPSASTANDSSARSDSPAASTIRASSRSSRRKMPAPSSTTRCRSSTATRCARC